MVLLAVAAAWTVGSIVFFALGQRELEWPVLLQYVHMRDALRGHASGVCLIA